MNNRFKPEISVVRPAIGVPTWVPTGISVDVDDQIPERALIVRGVPMVGERVVTGAGEVCEVIGHHAMLKVRRPNGMPTKWLAIHCSPAPDEDEALVERVARAIRDSRRSGAADDIIDWLPEARAAIRAMKEGA